MKQKTHSGAKKRLLRNAAGKVKRKKIGMRHLLKNKSSKRKRLLGKPTYVHSASEYQVRRLLVF
ncbi:MAG: 50S ribosomal protein L35 [Bdellovibrionales bacterium]